MMAVSVLAIASVRESLSLMALGDNQTSPFGESACIAFVLITSIMEQYPDRVSQSDVCGDDSRPQ